MSRKKEYPVTKPMHNPVHPGKVLKELVIKPLNLTLMEAAKRLDVDRTTLSRLINGHIALSVDMAIRISKALEGSAPEFWLTMQQNYDLAQARKRKMDFHHVRRFDSDGYRPSV